MYLVTCVYFFLSRLPNSVFPELILLILLTLDTRFQDLSFFSPANHMPDTTTVTTAMTRLKKCHLLQESFRLLICKRKALLTRRKGQEGPSVLSIFLSPNQWWYNHYLQDSQLSCFITRTRSSKTSGRVVALMLDARFNLIVSRRTTLQRYFQLSM